MTSSAACSRHWPAPWPCSPSQYRHTDRSLTSSCPLRPSLSPQAAGSHQVLQWFSPQVVSGLQTEGLRAARSAASSHLPRYPHASSSCSCSPCSCYSSCSCSCLLLLLQTKGRVSSPCRELWFGDEPAGLGSVRSGPPDPSVSRAPPAASSVPPGGPAAGRPRPPVQRPHGGAGEEQGRGAACCPLEAGVMVWCVYVCVQLHASIVGGASLENDAFSLYEKSEEAPAPLPPAAALTAAAVCLFGALYPHVISAQRLTITSQPVPVNQYQPTKTS